MGWRDFTDRAEEVLILVAKQREAAGWLGGIVFAVVFVWALVGVGSQWRPHDSLWIPVRLLYGAWTIAVPLWFFVEYIYCVDANDPNKEVARKERKAMQDAARPVWAGCVTALGLLLFMVGH